MMYRVLFVFLALFLSACVGETENNLNALSSSSSVNMSSVSSAASSASSHSNNQNTNTLNPNLIRLPVYFWVVTSSYKPSVSYEVTDQQLNQYLMNANRIWAAADIEFYIEAVNRVEMTEAMADDFEQWLTNIPAANRSREKRFEVLNSSGQYNGLSGQYNIVLMKEWGPVVGNAHFDTSSIFIAEKNKANEVRRHTILAHELGHALGLAHVDFADSACNLMQAGRCGRFEQQFTQDDLLIKTLNKCQIEIARGIALLGFAKAIDFNSANPC